MEVVEERCVSEVPERLAAALAFPGATISNLAGDSEARPRGGCAARTAVHAASIRRTGSSRQPCQCGVSLRPIWPCGPRHGRLLRRARTRRAGPCTRQPPAIDRSGAPRLPPAGLGLVRGPLRLPHRAAGGRLAGDPGRQGRPGLGAHRLGQDPRRLPLRPRLALPRGARGRASRRDPHPLRLAAQGPRRTTSRRTCASRWPGCARPRSAAGLRPPAIRAAVRTGDTPSSRRQAMVRRPPHVLVTTPESLYLLLTSEKGRRSLATVRKVIVDEIHAVARDKRGSHLALSLERLEALCTRRPAAHRPLGHGQPGRGDGPLPGGRRTGRGAARPSAPSSRWGEVASSTSASRSPGTSSRSVASNEQWAETYDRLAELARETPDDARLRQHPAARRAGRPRPRRAAGRGRGGRAPRQPLAGAPARRRGASQGGVAQGHRRHRLARARHRHRHGRPGGASSGSPGALHVALQRVGRSGHWRGATPEGALLPADAATSSLECAALVRAAPRRAPRAIAPPRLAARHPRPADRRRGGVAADRRGRALRARAGGPGPTASSPREEFDEVVTMLSEGIATRRGRSRRAPPPRRA